MNCCLVFWFHRNFATRVEEIFHNKSFKGNYNLRIQLKLVSGFAEHDEKAIYGWGYNLSLQKDSDNHGSRHIAGTDAGNRVFAESLILFDNSCYFQDYTPNVSQQKLKLEHIVSGAETQLSHIKRSSHTRNVTAENKWIFDFCVKSWDGVFFTV